jgi:hypothetical protein
MGNGKDGAFPYSGLAIDRAGNLYGTTQSNSLQIPYGTIFELSPNPDGTWHGKTLYDFSNNPAKGGYLPSSSLTLDAAGNLYGTAQGGGTHLGGVVFEVTP